MLTSNEIRNIFLDFFKEKGHKIVPSAPIVVKNDPTLMFTNAGMNQFKDYFLGNKQPDTKRIADTQKCLRVSGKHNDLEEVGIDTYHHTMFEMLGNWSFGDYFKEEAISWAWELLTERYKLPVERIYATVFEGDAKEGLASDEEARALWNKFLPAERILNGNKKDNFWEMGDSGPCGPCSEIHVDLRPQSEVDLLSGDKLVNNDHPQVIEIWNNVFIQYNRKADGSLEALPDRHVDTGMGFERLTRVIQGKSSNYDTDIFMPYIQKMELYFEKKYGVDESTDIAMRVIADHIRTITFTIADGQLPSNTGAGYVIRRILRRAVRYANKYLGMEEPFIYHLVPVLANQFEGIFPEVKAQQDFISKIIKEEEISFLRTLSLGVKRFENHIKELTSKEITGQFAFELYDTYGFPFDLTDLMARENGFTINEAVFKTELQAQKTRSKADAQKEAGDWIIVQASNELPRFVGYDVLEISSSIMRYREVSQKGKKQYQVVFEVTPFYPEGGGQIGDTGKLIKGVDETLVVNTFKENDLIISVLYEMPELIEGEFLLQVDKTKRMPTQRNHSATHLLQAALQRVLGSHVAQKGSLVNDKVLRFDFTHFSKMTDEEIQSVEKIVNEKILENIALIEDRNIPISEAISKGAMALFGEKYGENVRIITFGEDYSRELCGGTHVPFTGNIGLFKIISEGAIAAGVRRIEAITGLNSQQYVLDNEQTIKHIKDNLKATKSVSDAVDVLIENNKKLQSEVESLKQFIAGNEAQKLSTDITSISNSTYKLLIKELQLSNVEDGKGIVQEIKSRFMDTVVIIGAGSEAKTNIYLSIPETLAKDKGIHAGNIIKEVSKLIDGGGGGQPTFASAGGKNREGLQSALDKMKELVLEKMG